MEVRVAERNGISNVCSLRYNAVLLFSVVFQGLRTLECLGNEAICKFAFSVL